MSAWRNNQSRRTGSGNNERNQGELDLKLNLSSSSARRRRAAAEESPEGSPARSCVSSEESLKYSSSPESAGTSSAMKVAGCPRCFMYVMLSDVDRRCPRCKSTVLLDFQNPPNGGVGGGNHRPAAN